MPTVTKLSTHADTQYTPTTTPTKKVTKIMSLYPETVQAPNPQKKSVPGIGPVGGTALLRTLERLNLINHSPELHLLCAAGKASPSAIGPAFEIWQVDAALAETDATVSQRMAFKATLEKYGLLKSR